jgi:hypothetical protein
LRSALENPVAGLRGQRADRQEQTEKKPVHE